ncbi:MAG: DHH family phosphoesterase [Bacteroidales bacterium]|nr:DHH family phosphoesterase [Bacteroidales bacterium]
MKLIIAVLLGSSLLLSCSGPGNEFRYQTDALDWGTDTCLVYGHKAPDVDAVASSIALSRLMCSLGHYCEPRLAGPANRETKFVSGRLGFSLPIVQESVLPGTRIILTDHSEYAQSVNGVKEAKVLQIIDHHPGGDIDGVPFVVCDKIGAASTLVWELYGKAGVEVDNATASVLLSGILSDTHFLTKNATQRDSTALLSLAAQLDMGAEQLAELSKGMSEADSDYSGMSDTEMYLDDVRDYVMSGRQVRIGSLDWAGHEALDAFLDRVLGAMHSLDDGKTLYFAKVDARADDGTAVSYILYSGAEAEKTALACFGKPVREGVCRSSRKINRKYDLVPMLTKALE